MLPSGRKRTVDEALEGSDDSDSDDSLLLGGGLTQKRKSAKERKVENILNNALKNSQLDVDKRQRMATAMIGDETTHEETIKNAKKLIEEKDKAAKQKKESSPSHGDPLMDSHSSIPMIQDKGHRETLVEASETEQTDLVGIHRNASFTSNGLAPKSSVQVYQRLQAVLDAESMSPTLHETLKNHLQNGSIDLFLMTNQLFRCCRNGVKIPPPLLDWLMSISIAYPPSPSQKKNPDGDKSHDNTTMETLCQGAYGTVVQVLETPNKYLDPRCAFSLRYFGDQLLKWLVGENDAADGSLSSIQLRELSSSSSTSTKSFSMETIVLSRFFHIFELAFNSGRMNVANVNVNDDLNKWILHLILLGLDETLASKTTNTKHSALSDIERILNEVVILACGNFSDDDDVGLLTKELFKTLPEQFCRCLSPSGELFKNCNSNDGEKNDYGSSDNSNNIEESFLLLQVRSIRFIVSAGCNHRKLQSIELGIKLSIDVLQKILKVDSWQSEMDGLMDLWGISKIFQMSTPGIALASSVLALSKLLAMLTPDTSGKVICSVVEISHLCLQCSTSVGIVWDGNQNHHHRKFKEYAGEAYERLERLCNQVGCKTRRCVLADPHLLRANRYVESMRHYPRLMSEYYESSSSKNKKIKKRLSQGTMDSFLETKSTPPAAS